MLFICKDKTVYINTTFLENGKEEFIELLNRFPNVKGVNISRHTTSYETDQMILHGIAKDEDVLKINTNVRINCFVGDSINKEKNATSIR